MAKTADNTKKKKTAAKAKPKLSKADPAFYSKIGGMGGIKTRENNGPNYFRDIALRRHSRAKQLAAILVVSDPSDSAE